MLKYSSMKEKCRITVRELIHLQDSVSLLGTDARAAAVRILLESIKALYSGSEETDRLGVMMTGVDMELPEETVKRMEQEWR